jgi:hypothetical protein
MTEAAPISRDARADLPLVVVGPALRMAVGLVTYRRGD